MCFGYKLSFLLTVKLPKHSDLAVNRQICHAKWFQMPNSYALDKLTYLANL